MKNHLSQNIKGARKVQAQLLQQGKLLFCRGNFLEVLSLFSVQFLIEKAQ